MRRSILPGIAIILATCASALAAAQEVLEEITVTAQKREQSVNDVGITATVFDNEAIKELGIVEAYDIAAATPGLNMVANAGYTGKINFTLRGVGLNNFSEAQESAVAIYQDEIYVAPLIGAALGTFDLERIEVLRGPQGTLFGRSASGGLVHYISKRPGSSLEGYINAGYGSYDQLHAEGAVGGGISDTVSVRVSGMYNENSGWLKNLIGPDRYAEQRGTLRAQALFTPTDTFDFLLKVEYGELDNEYGVPYLHNSVVQDPDGSVRLIGPAENFYGVPGADWNGYRDTDGDFFTGSWDPAGMQGTMNEIDRTLVSGIINWDLGGLTLTSVTGFLDVGKDYLDDNDSSPVNFLRLGVFTDAKQFVQELRLAGEGEKYRWTGGLFYLDFDIDSVFTAEQPIGIPLFSLPFPYSWDSFTEQSKKSIAVFVQTEFDLSDRLTVIGGLRFESESVDFSYSQVYSDDALVSLILGALPANFNQVLNGDLAEINKDYLSGTLQLNWRFNDEVLLYLSARRGIKPAAFNTPLIAIPPENMQVDEEKLTAFELGAKSTLANGRIQLNAATWYYDYKDYQAVQLRDASTVMTNADATIYGLDLEVHAKLFKQTDLRLALSILNGNAEDIVLGDAFGGIIAVRDREIPNAPEYSANILLRHTWNAFGGALSLQGDVQLQGQTYYEIQNHPADTADAYAVGNIRLGWAKDSLELAAVVRNVWEEEYAAYLFDVANFGGYLNVTPGKPRWWGIEVTYRWGA